MKSNKPSPAQSSSLTPAARCDTSLPSPYCRSEAGAPPPGDLSFCRSLRDFQHFLMAVLPQAISHRLHRSSPKAHPSSKIIISIVLFLQKVESGLHCSESRDPIPTVTCRLFESPLFSFTQPENATSTLLFFPNGRMGGCLGYKMLLTNTAGLARVPQPREKQDRQQERRGTQKPRRPLSQNSPCSPLLRKGINWFSLRFEILPWIFETLGTPSENKEQILWLTHVRAPSVPVSIRKRHEAYVPEALGRYVWEVESVD